MLEEKQKSAVERHCEYNVLCEQEGPYNSVDDDNIKEDEFLMTSIAEGDRNMLKIAVWIFWKKKCCFDNDLNFSLHISQIGPET